MLIPLKILNRNLLQNIRILLIQQLLFINKNPSNFINSLANISWRQPIHHQQRLTRSQNPVINISNNNIQQSPLRNFLRLISHTHKHINTFRRRLYFPHPQQQLPWHKSTPIINRNTVSQKSIKNRISIFNPFPKLSKKINLRR